MEITHAKVKKIVVDVEFLVDAKIGEDGKPIGGKLVKSQVCDVDPKTAINVAVKEYREKHKPKEKKKESR